MNLKELERKIDSLSRRYEISWYSLQSDTRLPEMIINGYTADEIAQYLEEEYSEL